MPLISFDSNINIANEVIRIIIALDFRKNENDE